MSKINVLDQNTINQIAAGEVVERPTAVVKELVENAIDAGANAITVEIKSGGIDFIRVTDNGSGIHEDDMPYVFLRHSTSKIKSAIDLLTVSSLGFRGEALSSISAVSQVELVTKTSDALSGIRYLISGGEEIRLEHIGCPNGTTIIARNLFYNTPARRKFLKSATSEASFISELMDRLATSHPDISFKFINNNQIKLHTSGNGNLKDIIYNVFGREIAANLIPVHVETQDVSIKGFVAAPKVSRGNRSYENYFLNGRYIKSSLITKAIEEAFKPFSMTHRYPFTSLHFEVNSELIDVNVHPTKLEVRFRNGDEVYHIIYNAIKKVLEEKELIDTIKLTEKKEEKESKESAFNNIPEPFEEKRRQEIRKEMYPPKRPNEYTYSGNTINEEPSKAVLSKAEPSKEEKNISSELKNIVKETEIGKFNEIVNNPSSMVKEKPEQLSFLSEEAKSEHRIIGQVFLTYWLVEFNGKLYIIDQHAAHEKVLYEKTMKDLKEKQIHSQVLNPPIILSFSMKEQETIKKFEEELLSIGFEIEEFGGNEYAIRGVPSDLYGLAEQDILIELVAKLTDEINNTTPEIILEKIASISCKAAVKGNQKISAKEAYALIDQLLELENPYHCPHGRPTMIAISKYELEKKFKRIV